MPKCTILVGVPASGKSTWTRNKYGDYMAPVVSTDRIIETVAASYGMTYDEGFKGLIQFAEIIIWRQLTTYLMRRADFIIDRTNLSVKARAKFIQKLKLHKYEIECVVFPTPEPEEWKRRLNSRPGKTIPQEAIDRMVASYEVPTEAEGFNKITFM